jgi:peptidoglycan/LPS O-acetylase OafA/YrhL
MPLKMAGVIDLSWVGPAMNRQVSINLDAMRWMAALSVFLCHFSQLGYGSSRMSVLEPLGRIGVIVFFVMSGYVIAYVAEQKHQHFFTYMEARSSRLYSVFLPALLLTFVADIAGRAWRPDLYFSYPDPLDMDAFLSLPFFITFAYESSFQSQRWLSNGPAWSIAYEFWYYVIFGVAFYLQGVRRILCMGAALLLAGWKILLLFPIWLIGVALYRQRLQPEFLRPWRWPLFFLSMGVLLVLCQPAVYAKTLSLRDWVATHTGPGWHAFVLSDYLYALPVAGLLLVACTTAKTELPSWWQRVIKSGAGFSFSLYLFHVPLILLFRALGLYEPTSIFQSLIAAAVVILVIYLLATVTEHKKSFWLGVVRAVAMHIRKNVIGGAYARKEL